jgi:exodeoxyribonuclease-3
MKIISWNVNGIRACLKKGFLEFIKQENPDIICLQEIKTQESHFPEEIKNLSGYNFYISPATKPGYSGVAVLSKIKAQKFSSKIGIEKFDDEGRFLLLEFPDFTLFNTYFPHSRRDLGRLDFKMEFNQSYLKFIKKLQPGFNILTGDFNYAHTAMDLANPKQNEKNAGFTINERQFGDELEKLGWLDTFRQAHPQTRKYTWWTFRANARKRNIGWRIDYFFIPQKYKSRIKNAEILDKIMGSDHCPVLLELEI